jgi:hypothetical protein
MSNKPLNTISPLTVVPATAAGRSSIKSAKSYRPLPVSATAIMKLLPPSVVTYGSRSVPPTTTTKPPMTSAVTYVLDSIPAEELKYWNEVQAVTESMLRESLCIAREGLRKQKIERMVETSIPRERFIGTTCDRVKSRHRWRCWGRGRSKEVKASSAGSTFNRDESWISGSYPVLHYQYAFSLNNICSAQFALEELRKFYVRTLTSSVRFASTCQSRPS